MRVAFNATALLSPLTGIGQYSFHLASALVQRPGLDLEFFYGTGWSRQIRQTPLPHVRTLKSLLKFFIPNSYTISRALQQRNFNKCAKAPPIDIYHEPNFLAFTSHVRSVVTVHDLSWVRFPETHPIERVRAMDKYFEPGIKRASLILTDSEFVKRELMEVFRVDEARIRSIHLGVETLFRPRESAESHSVLSRLGVTHSQYLLSVGTLEPRKNIATSLRAYTLLPKALRSRFPLVIAGMKGWKTSPLETIVEPLVQSGEVLVTGYLTRDDLAVLTSGAAGLVYPSLYEGFGLPPLEAMASGVPVIASNVSSIPEVVGDAGILVDPQDAEELADAMRRLLTDEALRDSLSSKGLDRSALFTWENCVAQTVEAYKSACGMND